jgi:predicted nucleic acid-binding protein
VGQLTPRWCLDSWAFLRLLEDAEGIAPRVEMAIDEGAVMSWINAGEVYYVTHRDSGRAVAETVIDGLRARVTLDVPSDDRVLAAASIKAEHPMSYADAFACATAIAYDAPLLTGDDEILRAAGPWVAQDVRRS